MVERLRNSFPPEFISKQILVSGGAFRKYHEFRNEGEKKRFFFVLNKNPEQDDVILLVTASTKIEKLKLKYQGRPDLLVEISPSEYQPLEQPSIVNCEAARPYCKSQIQQFINNREIEPLQPLPANILEKLYNAIAKCKTIPPEDKRLVLGEEKTTD